MVIFLVANIMIHTDMQAFLHGLLPSVPQGDTKSILLYCYFAVGIISSAMMPYEVYFYSSGAIEEKWTPKDLLDNLFTTSIGMSLGGLLSASLLMLGSKLFSPLGINPQLHGTSVLLASIPFGKPGMVLGLLGIIFAIGGAAIETCFAGAYNIAQYFNWRWGRHLAPEKTPKFTKSWIVIFTVTLLVLMVGIDPVQLVEYAVIFSIVVLPFTYYAVFRVAANKNIMGKHANTLFVNAMGWIFFVIVAFIALAAVPLMLLTNMGQG
jgi:Mn2+/Fe2+ NRAMP family transporter